MNPETNQLQIPAATAAHTWEEVREARNKVYVQEKNQPEISAKVPLLSNQIPLALGGESVLKELELPAEMVGDRLARPQVTGNARSCQFRVFAMKSTPEQTLAFVAELSKVVAFPAMLDPLSSVPCSRSDSRISSLILPGADLSKPLPKTSHSHASAGTQVHLAALVRSGLTCEGPSVYDVSD